MKIGPWFAAIDSARTIDLRKLATRRYATGIGVWVLSSVGSLSVSEHLVRFSV